MVPRRAWSLLLALALLAPPVACGHSPAGTPPRGLRVMTYNIHFGHENVPRLAAVICAQGADVVALQEVDVHWSERSGWADQASEIAAACGMELRYGPIYDLPPLEPGKPNRRFGLAILTRLPVVAWENHSLVRLSTQGDTTLGPMPGFLQVTVDVGGTEVDVFNTHLDYRPDPSVRAAQVAEMLAIMGDLTRPTVLMGDMNAPPDRPELAPLLARLRDAWAGNPDPGFTYPGDAPVRRIDYVLVAGPLVATGARVPVTDASDHRPVVAELSLDTR